MTLWYTSDSHFSHLNIIRYCNRPFKDAQEMDEVLIANWNEVVQPEDHVWHLGDVHMGRSSNQEKGFIQLVRRLNGHKRLILGNHDYFKGRVYAEAGFEKVRNGHTFEGLLLTHYPVHPMSMGRAKANLHGHIHDKPSPPGVERIPFKEVWSGKAPVEPGLSPYLNVCVEMTDYTPIDLDEVKRRIRAAGGTI